MKITGEIKARTAESVNTNQASARAFSVAVIVFVKWVAHCLAPFGSHEAEIHAASTWCPVVLPS